MPLDDKQTRENIGSARHRPLSKPMLVVLHLLATNRASPRPSKVSVATTRALKRRGLITTIATPGPSPSSEVRLTGDGREEHQRACSLCRR